MFQFSHNGYFYAFALIPLFVTLFIWMKMVRKRNLRRFGDEELVNRLMPEASSRRVLWKFILLLLLFSLMITGITGPKFGTRIESQKRKGAELIIALDVSNSMMAEDIAPNRLERAKQALSKLVDRLGDDKIGLIVFAGEAFTQLPITNDYVSAKMFLGTISPEIVPVQGTAIGKAITLATASFSPASEAGKAIIVITDGENHEDNPVQAAQNAVEKGIIVHTVGIGSVQGTPIPIRTKSGQRDFIKDRDGNVVMSRLDEKTLQETASAGKGIYVRATASNMGLTDVLDEIDHLEKTEYDAKIIVDYAELFQWPFGAALLLLLVELLVSYKKNNKFKLF
jgi:Ca-activated chloride channel family protein